MSRPPIVRKNLLVTATGPTGCGKSRLLWELFAKKSPRLITFDAEGEAAERDPSCVSEQGYDGLRSALRYCVARSRRWHIALRASVDDQRRALALLSPLDGAAHASLSRELGGVAVMCDELDELAPRSAPEDVRGCWKRGRHDLLSIYGATQRPAGVCRDVTSQSHVLVLFATYEPADIEYARAARGPAVARALRELAPFSSLYCERGAPAVVELDRHYHIARRIQLIERLTLLRGTA